MRAPRRRWLRWLARGGAALASLVGLASICVVLVLGTSPGRRRVLDAILDPVNRAIPGRLAIDGLQRLDPFAIHLSGLRLYDPAGTLVLSLATLNVKVAPSELLSGRIVLPSLELGPGLVDLRDSDRSDRGLMAALVDPTAPATPPAPDSGPPPYVRVDRITVTALDIVAPALPAPWDALSVSDLHARARFEMDGAPALTLESLEAIVLRSDRKLATVANVTSRLAPPGEPSELSAALELESARLALSARMVLPPAPGSETSPLSAELRIDGLEAQHVSRLLADPGLAEAFVGPVTLALSVSGSLAELSARATLDSSAGALELHSQLRERRQLELAAGARQLILGRLRPGLPLEPLAFELESSLDLTRPEQLPLGVRVRAARFGSVELPDVSARGIKREQRIDDLRIELRRRESTLVVQGSADMAGAFDLATSLDIRPSELAEWALAAGVPAPPHGFVSADLRLGRSAAGVLSIAGAARAQKLRLPELELADAHADVELHGPPLALAGRATLALSGLSAGELHVPRASLALDAGADGYRLRGGGQVDRLRATFDLRALRDGERFVVRGSAGGRHGETPLSLRIERTVIDPAGAFESAGIALDAGGQRVLISGAYTATDADVAIRAPALDLAQLAQLAGLGSGWTGRARIDAHLRGRPTAPSLQAALALSDVSRNGERRLGATLAVQLDAAQGRAGVDLALRAGSEPLSLPCRQACWLGGSAALASEFRGGPGWERRLLEGRHHVRIELARLDLAGLEPWLGRRLPVTGELSSSVSLDGTLRQPALHAELRGEIQSSFVSSGLRLEQRLDYEGGALALRLDVDDAGGRWIGAAADLELPPTLAADVTTLAEQARGLAAAARWRLELAAAERRLGALSREVPPALSALAFAGQLAVSHAAGAEPAGHAALRVTSTGASRSPAGCMDAGVALDLELRLAERELTAALVARQRSTELLRAKTRASLELAGALRGGAATLGALSADLVSERLDLQRVPYLCGRLRGQLGARATLADLLGAEPSLAADVEATGLSLGAEPKLDLTLSARADRDDASANVNIRGPRGESTLVARVPIQWSAGRFALAADAPLSARARLVELPLAPLLDPSGALSYATGWLSGTVDVAGTLDAPEPRGELDLHEAELTATALAQPLHGVRGRFTFDRRGIHIERFEARDRDGALSLSGTVARRGADALDVKLDVKAKSFPLRQRGQVVATTSGNAKIEAALTRTRTDVSVKLVDADTWLEKVQARTGIDLRAHPDFVIAGAEPAGTTPGSKPADAGGSSNAGGSGTPPSAEETAASSHILLDASDHFWIKREDFAIQLATKLDATIEGEQTRVKGRVEIFRGYLDLYGRVFDVDRNSYLEFIGTSTPDPLVNITASYDHRSSGKTVTVQIGGRGSKPVLTFLIDDVEVSAGEVLEVLFGHRSSGGEDRGVGEAKSFVSGLTAGLLATSARRELGAAAPIIMIEPGEQTGDGRIRAGFELDALVPKPLRRLITGVYIEGIVEREGSQRGQGQEASTQAGVLVELYFPHRLFSTGQWGPGTTWSLDWGWQL